MANPKSCFNPLFWRFPWLCLSLTIGFHQVWQEIKWVTAGYFVINSFGKSHRFVPFHRENRNNIGCNSKRTNLGRREGCWAVIDSYVSSPRLSISRTYFRRGSTMTTQGFLYLQCLPQPRQQWKWLLIILSQARLAPKQPKVALTQSLKNQSK